MDVYTLRMVLGLTFGINEVFAGTWCWTQKDTSGSALTDCSWGCCTVNGRTRCCEETTVWVLVRSIVGGVIALTLVSLVVACCCMKRSRSRQGQVIATANSPSGYGTPEHKLDTCSYRSSLTPCRQTIYLPDT